MDTKLNTSRTADHGAGFHDRLARYTCHASGIALWIFLACWAGIQAAMNGIDAKKKAKWVRRIQGSTLRHVDFWSLQTAVAAAANVTKPTTQELAEVTLDPPDLRVWALFSSPLPARLSQIARPQAHRKQGLAPPPTCSADHQTSKDHGRAKAQRGASTCPAFRGPPVFGPVLLAGRICSRSNDRAVAVAVAIAAASGACLRLRGSRPELLQLRRGRRGIVRGVQRRTPGQRSAL